MKPQRPASLVFAQATLALQALAAVFALLTVWGLSRAGQVEVPPGWMWGAGAALVLVLGYAAGQQQKPWGRPLGWLMQAPMICAGLIVPAVSVIGVVFLVVWATGVFLGAKIDRERAERAAAEAGEAAEAGSGEVTG